MYTIVWTYVVKPEHVADFERAYNGTGTWVDFFRKGEGYLGTDLHRDTQNAKRYSTFDRWESQAAYESFSHRHAEEYGAIDKVCEAFTVDEALIGKFVEVQ